jgi:hypothetical protein
MHQGIPAIEGWGSPSCVWNVKEKNGENNRKIGKIGRTVT